MRSKTIFQTLKFDTQFGSKLLFFGPFNLEILWMTLKKDIKALLLCHFKFVHHFVTICELKLELQSGNTQFGSKLSIFQPVWPWNLADDLKKTGHIFYLTSSFVHHFIAICEFKLELQPGNHQFGSKLSIFRPLWPRSLTDDPEKQ